LLIPKLPIYFAPSTKIEIVELQSLSGTPFAGKIVIQT